MSEFHDWYRLASPETATSKKRAKFFLEMRVTRYLANPVFFKSELNGILTTFPGALRVW